MNTKKGFSLQQRTEVLKSCYEEVKGSGQTSEVRRRYLGKAIRLFLYVCVYNNMIDMTYSHCLRKPTDEDCYYWDCHLEGGKGELKVASEIMALLTAIFVANEVL
ncbi:hypothetical protein Tcan_09268 [Toxocara canis]|uniref:Uncharacterized protein n=1 Tax=Toxocara canis TaxID=6265 RepID=A0A0B2UNN3_TOXCA|nr:hypothetical protein Tcan_09268 [Toxocara canis]